MSVHHFQEQEKTENEKAELQAKVEEEITRLQENLKRLQQVSQDNVVQNRTIALTFLRLDIKVNV